MVLVGAVFLVLWAGNCLGSGGPELKHALGVSVADLTDMNFGESSVPGVAADQIASEFSVRDEEAEPAVDGLMKRQARCQPGYRKFPLSLASLPMRPVRLWSTKHYRDYRHVLERPVLPHRL